MILNPIGSDVHFERLTPGGGGVLFAQPSYNQYQTVSAPSKTRVRSIEDACWSAMPATRVQFPGDAIILENFFFISQFL